MNNIEKIIDLFYIQHLKVKDIAKTLNISSAYITKIIKQDSRYIEEKDLRKKQNKANSSCISPTVTDENVF